MAEEEKKDVEAPAAPAKKRRGRPPKAKSAETTGKATAPQPAAEAAPQSVADGASQSADGRADAPRTPQPQANPAQSRVVWEVPDLPAAQAQKIQQREAEASAAANQHTREAQEEAAASISSSVSSGAESSANGRAGSPQSDSSADGRAGAPRTPQSQANNQPQQVNQPQQGQQQLTSRQRWLLRQQQRQQQRWQQRNGANRQQSPQGNTLPPDARPSAQRVIPQMQPNVPRNPDLPEYRLSDIQSWDNGAIVAKMWPDANPEDLGALRRHEIIFGAIRSYLSRGGAVRASGCLEVVKEGYGFLRSAKNNFLACPEDVFVPQQQIRRHALRPGDTVEGPVRDPRDRDRYFALGGVVTVNGKSPSEAARIVHFENLVPTFPTRRIILETDPKEYSTRVVDIFTPIGFGQRGIIVAPPRVGKTVLLQKMANAITKNHPDAILIILLVDERPEEVTDMQRNTKALVLSSTFDEEPQHHVNVAEMVIEMSRRQVENGKDVVILLDSITRLARAYNTVQPHSGKILTGGVDALALHRPKRFFGAARNIENGGSLTIIATALIDTGSRMDEVIFEEFKGTGNMELVLDRGLADKRIFPAIDIEKSGTRKEDLLLDPLELEKTWALRRVLADAGPERAMQSVLAYMKRMKSNPEFLLSLDLKNL